MDTVIATFYSIASTVYASVEDFITLIVGNPYLLIGVSLMLIGVGFSFLKRLIRV